MLVTLMAITSRTLLNDIISCKLPVPLALTPICLFSTMNSEPRMQDSCWTPITWDCVPHNLLWLAVVFCSGLCLLKTEISLTRGEDYTLSIYTPENRGSLDVDFIFNYMCMCIGNGTWIQCRRPGEGAWFPWSWSYRSLWAAWQVLGPEPVSSARAIHS